MMPNKTKTETGEAKQKFLSHPQKGWAYFGGKTRADIINRWIIAVSCVMLYFSGLGQMPIYRRYNVVRLPGFSWADQYLVTVQIHYIFAAILMGAVIFILLKEVLIRYGAANNKQPPAKGDMLEAAAQESGSFADAQGRKYGAWRGLARKAVFWNLVVLIATGIVKIIQNLPGTQPAYCLTLISTLLHNAATFLLLAAGAVYIITAVLQRLPGSRKQQAGDRVTA